MSMVVAVLMVGDCGSVEEEEERGRDALRRRVEEKRGKEKICLRELLLLFF